MGGKEIEGGGMVKVEGGGKVDGKGWSSGNPYTVTSR